MKNENLLKAVCLSTNKIKTLIVGDYYYIANEFTYNGDSYVEAFNPDKKGVGIFKRNHFIRLLYFSISCSVYVQRPCMSIMSALN